jgi:hypothetical protein
LPVVLATVLLSLLLAAATDAAAQSGAADATAPATQPAQEDPVKNEPPDDRPPPPMTFGSPFEMTEEISPEEWEAVAAFTRQHSPQRWKSFMELPEDKQERVRRAMHWRFLQVERLKEQQPELFDLQVRRLAIEDQIFPLALQIRRAEGEETPGTQAAREELRKQVVALVEVGLKEREVRLERFKERLQAEEEQISLERGRKEETVDARMHDILRRSRRGPWPWRGGDGSSSRGMSGPDGRGGEAVGVPSEP